MNFKNLQFNLPTSRHPNPNLQLLWNYFQVSLLIFPLWPAVGAITLFLISIVVCKQQLKTVISRRVNWGLGIFTIWLLITVCFAFDRLSAFLGLGNLLPFFVIFLGFSILIQTIEQLRRISWILVITSVPVVILGLGQLFLNWTTPQFLQNIFGWLIEAKGNPTGRMASVFMYANVLAAYLVVVFILGLGLLISELKQKKYFSSPTTIFLSIAVIGSAIALILTDSRNAWTITILSCLAFALYLGWRWLVAIIFAIASSILWAAFGISPVREWLRLIVPAFFWVRLTDEKYLDRPVSMLRTTQWQFAWSMTQERPWTGWGLRNFTSLYQAKMQIWLGHPHNLFLMLSAETGIPATLILCSLVGWILAQGILFLIKIPVEFIAEKLIVFSYLLAFAGCTVFNTVDVTMFDLRVNMLGWLLLSAICGVIYKNEVIAQN